MFTPYSFSLQSSRSNRGSVDGYFLAGRNMHWVPVRYLPTLDKSDLHIDINICVGNRQSHGQQNSFTSDLTNCHCRWIAELIDVSIHVPLSMVRF